MTKEELKAELTALFHDALLAGEMPMAEQTKMVDLMESHGNLTAALFNEDPLFKRKGQLIAGMLLSMKLEKMNRIDQIKAAIGTNKNDARNN